MTGLSNRELAQSGRSMVVLAADTAIAAQQDLAQDGHSKRSSATSTVSQESREYTENVSPVESSPHATPHSNQRHGNLSTPASPISAMSVEVLAFPESGQLSEASSPTIASAVSSSEEEKVGSLSDRPMPPPPRGSRRRIHWGSATPAPRSQTPIEYTDLGKDYSRYPSPRPRISVTRASTPMTRRNNPDEAPHADVSQSKPLPNEAPLPTVTNAGYAVDPEKMDSWLLDDRIGAPATVNAGYRFPLYPDEEEVDDDLHMPRSDDDKRLRPKLRDFFVPNQLLSLIGLLLMLVGLGCVFILLPVLGASGAYHYSYPNHDGDSDDGASETVSWMKVNDVRYGLLKNVRTGLIDPDTPRSALIRKSFMGEDLALVFSDEFSKPNRTFYPGDDPYWTAPDFWYGATQDLEWYDPDAVTTADGTLTLRMDEFVNHGVNYRSGMINSWNQACFKGGLLEVSVSLPGPGGASGLWPGAWTMGHLGRPGYMASTDGLWPYSYDSCDVGITPNQSMTDGTSYLLGQRLPSCTCPGEDHPTPNTGRGAPEIDVFEASADPQLKLGVITQSYQVAPYDIWWQANYDYMAIPNYNSTQLNAYCGGPYQQAISGQTELNNDWYDGNQYQTYGFEYTPGTGSAGQIAWFVGDDMTMLLTGDAIGPNGNINSRHISEEPMTMVLNLGISPAWTGITYPELRFPTVMYVDYVRWYQPVGKTSATCDPPGYETTEYIKDHPNAYRNINLTSWDETGYGWPKQRLNTECAA